MSPKRQYQLGRKLVVQAYLWKTYLDIDLIAWQCGHK
jgi:hypothetical protein